MGLQARAKALRPPSWHSRGQMCRQSQITAPPLWRRKAKWQATLQAACGRAVPVCAKEDIGRFADPAANAAFYSLTQTYGLPVVFPERAGTTEDVGKLAPEAGYLLTVAFPKLTLDEANLILTETEGPGGGFLDDGSAFGVYSRLNLHEAAIPAHAHLPLQDDGAQSTKWREFVEGRLKYLTPGFRPVLPTPSAMLSARLAAVPGWSLLVICECRRHPVHLPLAAIADDRGGKTPLKTVLNLAPMPALRCCSHKSGCRGRPVQSSALGGSGCGHDLRRHRRSS